MTPRRILYLSGGGADLIAAHGAWAQGEPFAGTTSLTFSGQVADWAATTGAEVLMISGRGDGRVLAEGRFRIEHRRFAVGTGWRYHLAGLRNAWMLARAGRRFGADLAVVDAGVAPFFALALFRLFGMRLAVVLHNALWPRGHPPARPFARAVARLDGWFFRRVADATLAVSPEVERQVAALARRPRGPVLPFRPQFPTGYFAAMPPPPAWDGPEFRVLFVGRVVAGKGVFAILEMARFVEGALPGRVRWTLCGDGPDLAALRVAAAPLGDLVEVRGWTAPADLPAQYARAHAAIVPTASSTAEGLAMAAVEAVMAGRPLVTNPVVPAAEVLAPAVALAAPDDPASHAAQVVALASDRALYDRLRAACSPLGAPFLDRDQGLAAMLARVVAVIPDR